MKTFPMKSIFYIRLLDENKMVIRLQTFTKTKTMSKKIILLLLCHITLYTAFAQNVTISVNATQNKRLISPYIYGKNEGFDKPVQFYKDAGLRFSRMNGGNNASAYNWRAKIDVHPDWYNNVYSNDWDVLA